MDIIELLEEHDIQFWRTGKNVSRGWVGLQCPFCDDDSNHLGIHKKSLRCRCWKCGGHKLINTLMEVLSIPFKEAKKISQSLDAAPEGRDGEQTAIIDNYGDGTATIPVPSP